MTDTVIVENLKNIEIMYKYNLIKHLILIINIYKIVSVITKDEMAFLSRS